LQSWDIEQVEIISHNILGFAGNCGGKHQVVVRVAALGGAGTEFRMTYGLPAPDSFFQPRDAHVGHSEPLKDLQVLGDYFVTHDELEPTTGAP
jgi:hypothetical protein